MSYQFGGSQLQTQSVPNAKYKTMLCRHYLATKQCAIGAKCQFAHGTQEQRQMNDPLPASALSAMASGIEQPVNKPQTSVFQIPCKYHAQNYCKNGSNCQYMHDSDAVQQPNTINQQQIQVISSPLPQAKPEDPMQIVFQHILIEMQQIWIDQKFITLFPQDEIIQKLKIAFDQTKIGNLIIVSEYLIIKIYKNSILELILTEQLFCKSTQQRCLWNNQKKYDQLSVMLLSVQKVLYMLQNVHMRNSLNIQISIIRQYRILIKSHK